MFIGEYQHVLDTKKRVAVPAKFRAYFKKGIVVTRNSCKFFLKGCDPFCPCRFSTELFICLQTPAIRRVPNKLYFKDIHVYKSCLLYGKTLINKMPTVIKETN